MDVFAGHRALPGPLRAACVVIGNFDGVHRGHQALVALARERAAALGGVAAVLTFDPHPTAVLAPHLAPPVITSTARKLELLADAGADVAIVEPFTRELAGLAAPAFVDQVLLGAIGARHVVVGWDFTYGKGRGGTTSTLEAHAARAGFGLDVVRKIEVDGEAASSTRIRGALRGGDLAAARRLLGRRYDVDGAVVRGAGRGKALGIPTANVDPEVPLLLPTGIYACTLDGAPAVASLGTNPTFAEHGGRLVLEVHVLDAPADLDLYGRRVRVAFAARLRDEAAFDSVDALLAQIRRDCEDARAALAAGEI